MAPSKNKVEVLPQIVGSAIIAGREKMRLTQEQLAHQACLSKRQIMQLEEGGISTFYSEAHKITVAKKVAKLLNIDESQVLVDPRGDAVLQENLPFDQQESEVTEASHSAPVTAAAPVFEARAVRQEPRALKDARAKSRERKEPRALRATSAKSHKRKEPRAARAATVTSRSVNSCEHKQLRAQRVSRQVD